MNDVILHTIALLLAATIVALIARRLALPYSAGLVLAGIALSLAGVEPGLALTHDLIFNLILPPLLFEAAINIRWRELRADALPILALALPGTLIAAAAVTACMVLLLNWPVSSAALFAVLIAATDPVAVIAMFNDLKVTGRVRLLVECEALFNDAVAAVLFTLALAVVNAGGAGLSAAHIAATAALTIGGGLAIGFACAGAAIYAAGRTDDHLIEGALTSLAAYVPFLLAEHFHASGVLATVTAGIVIGNAAILSERETGRVSVQGREFILGLWEFIAFIANSVVFLLIGFAVAGIRASGLGAERLALIMIFVLAARALTVYPLCLLFSRSRWAVPMPIQDILWWGGLRGALGLALALSLPDSLPYRSEILVATFAVVAFSVIIQGLTMPLLLRRV
jgi:CPA1 family monovalent cation:H+ antiporter